MIIFKIENDLISLQKLMFIKSFMVNLFMYSLTLYRLIIQLSLGRKDIYQT